MALDILANISTCHEVLQLQYNISNVTLCDIVKAAPACQFDHGIIQYNTFVFCSPIGRGVPIFAMVVLLLILLVLLATSADAFFVPCLVSLAKFAHMSDNLAGVTLLAFGNGAPDLFSSISAVQSMEMGNANLAFGSALGGALLVNCVCGGVIVILRRFKSPRRPIVKDLLFYLATLAWILSIFLKKRFYFGEAVGFLCFYVIYVVITIFSRVCSTNKWTKKLPTIRFFKKKVMNIEITETSPPLSNGHLPRLPSSSTGIIPVIHISSEDDLQIYELPQPFRPYLDSMTNTDYAPTELGSFEPSSRRSSAKSSVRKVSTAVQKETNASSRSVSESQDPRERRESRATATENGDLTRNLDIRQSLSGPTRKNTHLARWLMQLLPEERSREPSPIGMEIEYYGKPERKISASPSNYGAGHIKSKSTAVAPWQTSNDNLNFHAEEKEVNGMTLNLPSIHLESIDIEEATPYWNTGPRRALSDVSRPTLMKINDPKSIMKVRRPAVYQKPKTPKTSSATLNVPGGITILEEDISESRRSSISRSVVFSATHTIREEEDVFSNKLGSEEGNEIDKMTHLEHQLDSFTPSSVVDQTVFDDGSPEMCDEQVETDRETIKSVEIQTDFIFPGTWNHFVQVINPINVEEWEDMNCFYKALEVARAPFILVLRITTSVVDYEYPLKGWCKILNCLHCIFTPIFWLLPTKWFLSDMFPGFPLILFFVFVCPILFAIVWFTSNSHRPPPYHFLYSLAGCATSVMWIYNVATEIVNILSSFGLAFSISNAILGLTLLAWSNSIGDLMSNIALAKSNYPRVGMAACVGGPLFSSLVALGLSFTIKTVSSGGFVDVIPNLTTLLLVCTLMGVILLELIMNPICKFQLPRWFGILLICIYVIFLLVALLCETKVIPSVTFV